MIYQKEGVYGSSIHNVWISVFVALYQFYRLDNDGEILDAAIELDCSNDDDAMAVAATMKGNHSEIEIWTGARLVGRITPV